MIVRYSCFACGVHHAEIEVPDREHDEPVVHWVGETVARVVGEDHQARYPKCREEKLSELEIPFPPGTDKLGAPVKN